MMNGISVSLILGKSDVVWGFITIVLVFIISTVLMKLGWDAALKRYSSASS
jgi:ABC-type uncharacterized transport system permease subunit